MRLRGELGLKDGGINRLVRVCALGDVKCPLVTGLRAGCEPVEGAGAVGLGRWPGEDCLGDDFRAAPF